MVGSYGKSAARREIAVDIVRRRTVVTGDDGLWQTFLVEAARWSPSIRHRWGAALGPASTTADSFRAPRSRGANSSHAGNSLGRCYSMLRSQTHGRQRHYDPGTTPRDSRTNCSALRDPCHVANVGAASHERDPARETDGSVHRAAEHGLCYCAMLPTIGV